MMWPISGHIMVNSRACVLVTPRAFTPRFALGYATPRVRYSLGLLTVFGSPAFRQPP